MFKTPCKTHEELYGPASGWVRKTANGGKGIKEGSLTGNRRFRRQLEVARSAPNELLVLQVQVNLWLQGREDKVGRWGTGWRDATPDDVSKEEVL
jgi:hypothetical protein